MAPDPDRKRRRGIYLLPNLFTTGALFFGFLGMIAGIEGDYRLAALGVLVAMILDGLDGRVARLTQTQTDFGVEFDSLSDMACFALAPAVIMHQWALADWSQLAGPWGTVGWIGAFTYAACGALRLARFNTQAGVAEKRYFQGLPSPASAGVVVSMVWLGASLEFDGQWAQSMVLVTTVAAGLLMVSNFRYYSFKEFDIRYRVPFIVLVVPVLGIAAAAAVLAVVNPPMVLFLGFFGYAASGPAVTVINRRRALGRRVP